MDSIEPTEPWILYISLEAAFLIWCRVPIPNKRVGPGALSSFPGYQSAELFDRNPKPLPSNFTSNCLGDFAEPRVRNNLLRARTSKIWSDHLFDCTVCTNDDCIYRIPEAVS